MNKVIYILTGFLFLVSKQAVAQYIQTEQCIGGNGNEVINKVVETPDGGILIVVGTNSNDHDFTDNHGGYDIGLIKLNNRNEIEWKKSIGTDADDYTNNDDYIKIENNRIVLRYHPLGPVLKEYYAIIDLDGNVLATLNLANIFPGNYTDSSYKSYHNRENIGIVNANEFIVGAYYWQDTTFHIAKVNANNDVIWRDTISIFEQYRNISCVNTSYSKLSIQSAYFPLQNGNFILNLYMLDDSWSNCYQFYKFSNLYLYNTNGSRLKSGTIDYLNENSTNFIAFSKLYESNNELIVHLGMNSNIITKINKETLSNSSQNLTYGKRLLFKTDDSIQYFVDEQSSLNTIVISKESLSGIIYFQTIFNNAQPDLISSFYSFPQFAKYIEEDKSLLILFDADNGSNGSNDIKKLVKIDSLGNLVYIKGFNATLNVNNFYISNYLCNLPWYPGQQCIYNQRSDYPYVNYNNGKLFFYQFYKTGFNFIESMFQCLTVVNANDGTIAFTYKNDVNYTTSLLYKYFFAVDQNQIMAVSDFKGTQSCNLGGYDILFSKIITSANKVYGAAFIDYNNNHQYDGNDVIYNTGLLESSKGSQSIATLMHGNVFTKNYVDTGTWITRLLLSNNHFSSTPVQKITTHADYNNADTVIFALLPVDTVPDLSVNMVNTFVTRLGSYVNYEITYANHGTHTADGTLKLLADSRLQYQLASPAASIQSNDTLIWNFSGLKANEVRKVSIRFTTPVPPDLNVSDTLISTAWVQNDIQIDEQSSDNMVTLKDIVVSSYDPNDKYSTTDENITPAQVSNGEYITYVIRFQNVGNDMAFRVVLLDTLDANLDWNTLEVVNASHQFTVELLNKNIIKCTSVNMTLPHASANENASHGFIVYKIKPKQTVAIGSTIKNTAHIYFDFNPPIATNTVQTHVMLLSAIRNTVKNNGFISIYPNPNNGVFNLQVDAAYRSPLSVEIFDISGKIVYQNAAQHDQKTVFTVQTKNLAGGIYLVRVNTDKEQFTGKILIEN